MTPAPHPSREDWRSRSGMIVHREVMMLTHRPPCLYVYSAYSVHVQSADIYGAAIPPENLTRRQSADKPGRDVTQSSRIYVFHWIEWLFGLGTLRTGTSMSKHSDISQCLSKTGPLHDSLQVRDGSVTSYGQHTNRRQS